MPKLPNFSSQDELFDHLKENKSILIAEKKNAIKYADAISFSSVSTGIEKTTGADKAIENPDDFDGDRIKVKSVINTTNVMDSHSDVHLKGIWTKSVKENKNIFLLQEHQMRFDKVISRDVKAMVREMTWKELGVNAPGISQALIFNSTIKRATNEFMFDEYVKGHVTNHSVGMKYVDISLAINKESYEEEFAVWEKHIDKILNKEEVEAQGYFWAVTQAKIVEGSAVLMGSNRITPTLDVNQKEAATSGTSSEPQLSTQEVKNHINQFNFNL